MSVWAALARVFRRARRRSLEEVVVAAFTQSHDDELVCTPLALSERTFVAFVACRIAACVTQASTMATLEAVKALTDEAAHELAIMQERLAKIERG